MLGLTIGCVGMEKQLTKKPKLNKAFEIVVGTKEQIPSAVKVGNKRITVGAIIGRDQVLTIARKDKEAKFIDTYSSFEGRTFMPKVNYDVVKQDPKLNISLLETKKELAGQRDILEVTDAKEGPCTVISLYDAKIPKTNSRAKLYNFHQIPLYPYERKGKIYDKNKVTCDLGGLVNLEHPKEIITRDALGRINKRAPLKSDNPDFWDYYDDSGSLIIQDGKLVGLITNSVTVVYSKNGKTEQRLDGEMITGQDIKKFLQDGKRKVYVKIAVDEEYRSMPFWKKTAQRGIKKASKVFEEQFGIEFVVTGFENWDSDDKTRNIHDSMAELKREVSPGINDVVIGFTGQSYRAYSQGNPEGKVDLGVAEGIGRGRYIIVTDQADYKHIIHEKAHLFGAVHVPGLRSIMHPDSKFSTSKFCDSNKERILRHKYRNFHKR